jgi:hydrogenase nickel incorporation protein HypA/HybF
VHELSIAMSLVDVACDELPRLGEGARILAVRVRLGPLSGVVKEALLFSFDVAANGSPLEGARLDVEDVPVTVYCAACAAVRELEVAYRLRCPVCDEATPEVVSGRELQLVALEVSDAADR